MHTAIRIYVCLVVTFALDLPRYILDPYLNNHLPYLEASVYDPFDLASNCDQVIFGVLMHASSKTAAVGPDST